MSNRLEELYEQMVDEAPVNFGEAQKPYIFELAKIYVKECCQASLEKASENAEINKMSRNSISTPYHIFSQERHQHDRYVKYEIKKSTITNEENIVIL